MANKAGGGHRIIKFVCKFFILFICLTCFICPANANIFALYDHMTENNWNRGSIGGTCWQDLVGASTVTAYYNNTWVYDSNYSTVIRVHYDVMYYGSNYYAQLDLGIVILNYNRSSTTQKNDYIAIKDGAGWKYHYSIDDIYGNHSWDIFYNKDKTYTIYRDSVLYASGDVTSLAENGAYQITNKINNEKVQIDYIIIETERMDAPTGLNATATSYNEVQLTWQANTDYDLAGYIIYRDYVEIARVGATETSYTDSGLNPNISYTYGIRAYNTSNLESDMSNAATVTTPKPPAPGGLTISDVTATGAKVTWNPVAGADSYNIYLDGNPVYNTAQTQYDITGLAPGTSHTVEVRTVISGIESDPVTASFTTLPLAAPTGLNAMATSFSQVQLTWQANTEPDLAGYIIYRDYVEITRVGATETSYTDSGLQPDTTYTYGIMAYNTDLITSDMSNAATVTTPELPKPVLTVRVDNRMINISWTGTADSFLVMINDQQIASISGNQYSYYAQPGSYKVQVIAVYGEYRQASDPVNVNVSKIEMPGNKMVSDVLSSAGMVLYPAGGLLALALALKASPWIVAAVKTGLFRKYF